VLISRHKRPDPIIGSLIYLKPRPALYIKIAPRKAQTLAKGPERNNQRIRQITPTRKERGRLGSDDIAYLQIPYGVLRGEGGLNAEREGQDCAEF
jgi:hypothetical protein